MFTAGRLECAMDGQSRLGCSPHNEWLGPGCAETRDAVVSEDQQPATLLHIEKRRAQVVMF